jgi:phospholipid/cholesterol/gamma-HCH transport system substrate-binding protein
MSYSNEVKVGFFVTGTLLVSLLFAWWIGVQNPFLQSVDFYVTYRFAGGIEVGSPVRVSGIKVGKVEKIDFFIPNSTAPISIKEAGSFTSTPSQTIYPLRLKISVKKEAARAVRKDSRFYINLAGLIGDRYIEITPGTLASTPIQTGDVVAGVDPPRIDQLLSQSFDLADTIKKIVDENKGDLTRSIELLYKLSGNLNSLLKNMNATEVGTLIHQLVGLTKDLRGLAEKINTTEGKKTIALLHELLLRLEPLDSKTIRQFFQKEGVKVNMF